LKNGADFLNGVQVGVEILTSKIHHENGDKFKKKKRCRIFLAFQ
jgi:hypothetical protein